jgi:hypothetical protein
MGNLQKPALAKCQSLVQYRDSGFLMSKLIHSLVSLAPLGQAFDSHDRFLYDHTTASRRGFVVCGAAVHTHSELPILRCAPSILDFRAKSWSIRAQSSQDHSLTFLSGFGTSQCHGAQVPCTLDAPLHWLAPLVIPWSM